MKSENERKDYCKGCKGSLTKLEFQEALSKRHLQARVLHERRLSLNRADNIHVYNTRLICGEQAKLHKQLQRLENVKRKNKENSFLNEEMRLLPQKNELTSVNNEKFPKGITLSNTLEVPNPTYKMEINSNNRQLLTPINEEPTRAHSRAVSPSPTVTQTRVVTPVNSLPPADAVTKARALTTSTELSKTRTVTQVHNLTPVHGLEQTRAVNERRALTPTRDIIPTIALPKTQTQSHNSVLIPTVEVTPADELSPTHGVTQLRDLTPLRTLTPVPTFTPIRSITTKCELPTTRAVTPISDFTCKRTDTLTRDLIPPLVLTPASAFSTKQTLTSKGDLTPLRPHAVTPLHDSKSENTLMPKLDHTPSRAQSPIRSVTPTRALTLSEDLITPARALTPWRAVTPTRLVTSTLSLTSAEDSITPARALTPSRALTPTPSFTSTRALTPLSDITQKIACTVDVTSVQNDGPVSRSLKDKEEKTATELDVPLDSEKSKKLSRFPGASPARCSLKLPRRESVILSCPNVRRGSLPAYLYLLTKSVCKFRRFSTPANSFMIPVIQVETTEDEPDNNQGKLNQLYTKAIDTIQRVDLKQLEEETGLAEQGSSSDLDLESLRKLQAILTNDKTYSDRLGQKDDPRRLEMSQKRKIEELESVLKKLDPDFGNTFHIDPVKELECTYLRLTKSNVEYLENMIREQGKDPGIHRYTDVTEYDIWSRSKDDGSEKER